MTANAYIDPSDVSGKIQNLQLAGSGTVVALANAAGQTLTVAQVVGKTLLRSGAAAVSDTFPTAAALVAASGGASVGDSKNFEIRNTNSGTLTLVAGTGNTLEGTTTVATSFTRSYRLRYTNVTPGSEAVTISGIFTAAV